MNEETQIDPCASMSPLLRRVIDDILAGLTDAELTRLVLHLSNTEASGHVKNEIRIRQHS